MFSTSTENNIGESLNDLLGLGKNKNTSIIQYNDDTDTRRSALHQTSAKDGEIYGETASDFRKGSRTNKIQPQRQTHSKDELSSSEASEDEFLAQFNSRKPRPPPRATKLSTNKDTIEDENAEFKAGGTLKRLPWMRSKSEENLEDDELEGQLKSPKSSLRDSLRRSGSGSFSGKNRAQESHTSARRRQMSVGEVSLSPQRPRRMGSDEGDQSSLESTPRKLNHSMRSNNSSINTLQDNKPLSLKEREDRGKNHEDNTHISAAAGISSPISDTHTITKTHKQARISTNYRRSISNMSFSDSQSMVSTAYELWFKNKLEKKQRERAARLEEEEKRNQIEKNKSERKMEAEIYFKAWKRSKDEELLKAKQRQRFDNRTKEENTKSKKAESRQDAEQIFRAWKHHKLEKLKEEAHKKKSKEKYERQQKEEEERIKKEDASKSFQSWKRNKEEQFKEMREKSAKICQANRSREASRNSKDKLALEAYNEWLVAKETQELQDMMTDKSENPEKPPWLPTNNTSAVQKNTRNIRRSRTKRL